MVAEDEKRGKNRVRYGRNSSISRGEEGEELVLSQRFEGDRTREGWDEKELGESREGRESMR